MFWYFINPAIHNFSW